MRITFMLTPCTEKLCVKAAVNLQTGAGDKASDQLPPLLPLLAALRRRIREGRRSNQVAGVGALVTRDETFDDTGIHGAIGGSGLVRKAAEVGLKKVLLEVFARISGYDFIVQP